MNARVQKLAEALAADEAALILSEANRRYYTGFPSSNGALIVTKEAALFLTDFRYIEAANATVKGIPCKESHTLFSEAVAFAKKHGVTSLRLEAEHVTLAQKRRFLKQADGVFLETDTYLDGVIREQRRLKNESEIALIRRAQAVTEDGFAYILERLTVGRTEKEVALDLEMYMRRQGAEAVAFDFIVASGENSSLPHAVPGDRRLQHGDFVTMDFGATVDGYRSDMTRTVVIGSVSEEQRLVYATVLEAQKTCLEGLRVGMTGEEGDRLARAVIEKAGYGAAFGHSTGHGVGLDIHEWPTLSTNVQTRLLVGDVVTVEPGIYLEGRFGVRIEDMVWMTADGCVNLTTAPKELLVL